MNYRLSAFDCAKLIFKPMMFICFSCVITDLPIEVAKPLCAPNKASIVEEGTCVLECVLNKSNQSFAWYKNDVLIDMLKEEVRRICI